jgi:PAS domain S-box-containing protein
MGEGRGTDGSNPELRRRAEERVLAEETAGGPKDGAMSAPSAGTTERMLHELQVRQVELEMQNDELLRASVKLEFSCARYQDLYDFAPVAYFSVDAQDVIREANLTAASMLGVDRGVLVGSPFSRYVCPKDLEIYARHATALVRSDEPQAFELRLSGPGGSPSWCLLKSVAAKEVDGSPVARIAATDIADRKRMEDAWRESEAKYRSIGESIDYGVWVCAPDGRNLYASQSFLDMVGITQEQCSNFGWGNVLHPDDSERTIRAWKECVRTGGKWDIEHRFRGVDGEWHHVLARGVPVRNAQGEILCWAGINLDITERKRTEEELKASLAEKDILMRELAHRTKNNMQVIASLIALQAASLGDRQVVEALEDTRDRIRAMALVHENIYRSDSLAALGMRTYARDLVGALLRAHRGSNGTVTPVFDIEDIPVPLDAAVALGLIINELATNSLKHAFADGRPGRIFLSLRRTDGEVELRYGDDGPGLPRELDPAQSRSLGLKLVRSIAIRQLRGEMEIRHEPVPEFVFRFRGFSHMEVR